MEPSDVPVDPEPCGSGLNPTLEGWLRRFGQPAAAGASSSAPSVRRLSMYGSSTDSTAKRLNFNSPPLQPKQPCNAQNNEHQELLSLRVECARLQSRANKLNKEKTEIELSSDKELRRLRAALQELDAQIKHCHEHHEGEIDQLSRRLQDAKAARTKADEQCDALRTNADEAVQKCNALQQTVFKLERDCSSSSRRESLSSQSAAGQCAQAEAHAQQLHNECTELRAALERTSAQKAHIDVQRLQAENKYQQLRAEHDDWLLKHATLHKLNADTQQLHTVTGENQALKKENTRLKQNLTNISLLREQLHSAEAKIERLQKTQAALEHENSELKLAVAEGSSSLALDKLMGDKDRLTQQLQQANQRMSDLLCGKQPAVPEEVQQQLKDKDEMIDALKEKLNMKGDFDASEMKVMHMEFNPLQQAHEEYQQEMKLLKEENLSLKMRVDALDKYRRKSMATSSQSASADGAAKDDDDGDEANDDAVDDTANRTTSLDVTAQVHKQMDGKHWQNKFDDALKQIEALKAEREKSRGIAAELARNYREMCTALTGYQFKLKDGNICQVESIFDRGEENEKSFFFQKSESGEIQLLESTYIKDWEDFVDAYLTQDNCIPAFLAAVTMQLVQREHEAHENDEHDEPESDEVEEEDEQEEEGEDDCDDEEEVEEPLPDAVQPFRMAQSRPTQPPAQDPDTSGSDIVMLD